MSTATKTEELSLEKGFTLIELLVVVLIIGILVSIAAPTFLSQGDKANIGAIKSLESDIQLNVKSWQTNGDNLTGNNDYPTGASLISIVEKEDTSATGDLYVTPAGGSETNTAADLTPGNASVYTGLTTATDLYAIGETTGKTIVQMHSNYSGKTVYTTCTGADSTTPLPIPDSENGLPSDGTGACLITDGG